MNYNCTKCTKIFDNIRSLNAHQVNHKDGERYSNRGSYKNRKPRKSICCLNCNVNMEVIASSSKKYCSNACQQEFTVKTSIESGIYTESTARTWFKKTTEYKCSCCGIFEWMNKPLVLQIDHIDGNNSNNNISNLRYLCANCHTQTDTWGVKNASEEGYKRMCESNKRKAQKRIGSKVFMDARSTVTAEEGDRYPLEPPCR